MLDENYSTENIERKLIKLVKNQRWTNMFCRDERDCYVCYTQTYRNMCKDAEMLDIPYVSSVYNEELALQIIKKFVMNNAGQIAEWLAKPEKTNVFSYIHDTPLGIVKEKGKDDFANVFSAMITIRKCGNSNRNTSGFYVESITPIPEIAI